MNRRLLTLMLAAFAALAVTAPALAHDRRDLGCGDGKVVVNVAYTVKNDFDTTVPIANVKYDWANDAYKRHIVVLQKSADTFCAMTVERGMFTTLAGHSPAGTSTIPAGITGRFFGGYVSNVFHATLLATPTSPTTGDLGMKDFACVASSDHNDATKSCPGSFDWFSQYFASGSGADFQLAKYLFVYHAEGHGTWIDSERGGTVRTHGDIVATAPAAERFAAFTSQHREDREGDRAGHCHH